MSEVYDLKCFLRDYIQDVHLAIKNEILRHGGVRLVDKMYEITKTGLERLEAIETKYEKTLQDIKTPKKKKKELTDHVSV
jgi:DNA-binding PadR family transcriptional regulator